MQRVNSDWLLAQRWFAGKARLVQSIEVVDSARWGAQARVELLEVHYADGGPSETYVLASAAGGGEALADPGLAGELLDRLAAGGSLPTAAGGRFTFEPAPLLGQIPPESTRPAALLGVEQSNTSVRYDHTLLLKLFRRLQLGPNPEVEVSGFLTRRAHFSQTPQQAGAIAYHTPAGERADVALLQTFVPNCGDAWRTTLGRLAPVLDGGDPADSLTPVRRLGETTANLHLALASDAEDAAFAPEPISAEDIHEWTAALQAEVSHTCAALRSRGHDIDEASLQERVNGLDTLRGCWKTRHHGDYHLGQVLETPDGQFVIIDFEGEPSRPLAVRRAKRSPLRDVAGMLRSLDYARHAGLRAGDASDPRRAERAAAWHARARAAFLDGYHARVEAGPAELMPGQPPALAEALSALELEKAAYEVLYELNHRPDWLAIPLAALDPHAA